MSGFTIIDQATQQLNFLLMAQRNIVLISAFAITLATFKKNFDYPFMDFLVLVLLIYSIGVGVKSALDFDAYVKDAKEDTGATDNELDLLARYEEWVYFTYILIGIVIFIILTFAKIEFFDPWYKLTGLKKSK
jgi:hypothetical protein